MSFKLHLTSRDGYTAIMLHVVCIIHVALLGGCSNTEELSFKWACTCKFLWLKRNLGIIWTKLLEFFLIYEVFSLISTLRSLDCFKTHLF